MQNPSLDSYLFVLEVIVKAILPQFVMFQRCDKQMSISHSCHCVRHDSVQSNLELYPGNGFTANGIELVLQRYHCQYTNLLLFGSFGLSTREPCTVMLCASCASVL